MKKQVLFFCIALSCASCDFWNNWGDGQILRNWYVVNITEQILILKCPYSESLALNDLEYKEFEIRPGASVLICGGEKSAPGEKTAFDYYFKKSAQALGNDVSWQILSENGEVLKTWTYSDKGISDQVFFERDRWWLEKVGVFISTVGHWSFYIKAEDLITNQTTF
jgi:hypothetical protein